MHSIYKNQPSNKDKRKQKLYLGAFGMVLVDLFYSESNVRYLEKMAQGIARGRAHFAEHELVGTKE